MAKKHVEILEILEAFDLPRCASSAAHLASCDPKTCGFRTKWITDSGRIGSVIPGFWITPLKEVVARSA